MAIHIRNAEVEALARDLAGRLGTGMTEEILVALKERRDRIDRQSEDRLVQIQAIISHCAGLPVSDKRTPEAILGYAEEGAF